MRAFKYGKIFPDPVIKYEVRRLSFKEFNNLRDESETVSNNKPDKKSSDFASSGIESSFHKKTLVDGIYVVPVYVGVGLRLTANITVLKGEVNLSNLAGVAASIKAGQATGSLVVQTLGISGEKASDGLLFSSTLDETTVQNAVLSLGKIKSIIHSKDKNVVIRPSGLSST